MRPVVLIEGGPYGTTCARVGCMPSKLLIAAAEAAHAMERAPASACTGAPVRMDGREVMARVKRERDRFVKFVWDDIDLSRCLLYRGHARFENDNTIVVDHEQRIKAKSIVIATGSRATYPDTLKKLGDRLIINDDVFEWRIAEIVVVIGPGVIGLELGQALHLFRCARGSARARQQDRTYHRSRHSCVCNENAGQSVCAGSRCAE